jgi:hypothetical protein
METGASKYVRLFWFARNHEFSTSTWYETYAWIYEGQKVIDTICLGQHEVSDDGEVTDAISFIHNTIRLLRALGHEVAVDEAIAEEILRVEGGPRE